MRSHNFCQGATDLVTGLRDNDANGLNDRSLTIKDIGFSKKLDPGRQ